MVPMRLLGTGELAAAEDDQVLDEIDGDHLFSFLLNYGLITFLISAILSTNTK